MDRPRVYIETTIPSAYFDERTAPEMVARREVTRRWWAASGNRYDKLTSGVVREELTAGPPLRAREWLSLIDGLPLLEVTPRIVEIASIYRRHKLMPPGDAYHLAVASCHRCDYLLTWNIRHLANTSKFGHIQRVNRDLDLFVPRIVPPPELMGEHHEQA
jgi:predicted nucleic acid-binding protein